jgi:Tfp pilus assembly protein PilF
MTFDHLDADELLRLGLDAMNSGRDADALVALKTLVEREPAHAAARYLLAAQHAQMGLMDKAEAGFREAVALAPEFPMARFQLGQLLLTRGASAEARVFLLPLAERGDAIGRYAAALAAAAQEDRDSAIAALREGLALPQEVPALAGDMQRVLENLLALGTTGDEHPDTAPPAAPIFLTGYSQTRAD